MQNEIVRIFPIRWAHFMQGGTGVKNITSDIEARTELYLRAALNLKMDGITLVNRTIDGKDYAGWRSLHDCAANGWRDLSDFWEEVRRLDAIRKKLLEKL